MDTHSLQQLFNLFSNKRNILNDDILLLSKKNSKMCCLVQNTKLAFQSQLCHISVSTLNPYNCTSPVSYSFMLELNYIKDRFYEASTQVVAEKFQDFYVFFRSYWTVPHVLTSPSLFLPAVSATSAPLSPPLPLGCALPCHGRGYAEPGGSWWTPADTGRCGRHGAPPAGHGSTFLLLPEEQMFKDKK